MTAITLVMLFLNILFMADLTINHKAHSELGYLVIVSRCSIITCCKGVGLERKTVLHSIEWLQFAWARLYLHIAKVA